MKTFIHKYNFASVYCILFQIPKQTHLAQNKKQFNYNLCFNKNKKPQWAFNAFNVFMEKYEMRCLSTCQNKFTFYYILFYCVEMLAVGCEVKTQLNYEC